MNCVELNELDVSQLGFLALQVPFSPFLLGVSLPNRMKNHVYNTTSCSLLYFSSE